ncbi:MAG: hypothetical protein A3F43_02395 [Gammaproteobacteria bacterium RIFCSPHIGHO2_12_FULL_42_10]|nr:MAG: hypothetical protein A3F43_02395 [Gammaproteobacteria bacterium RIFCSPHIGHO2_12_FULL_42_10]
MTQALLQKEAEKKLLTIAIQLLTESGTSLARPIELTDSLSRHLGIDSLGRAELFHRVEKQFHITMPDRLLTTVDTLGEIANYIESTKPTASSLNEPLHHASHSMTTTVDPARASTLIEILQLYASLAPEKPHIYFQQEEGGGEVILTYGELYKKSQRVANHLRALDLHEGEAVGIMQPTSLEFFYVFFGTLFAGGIPVPLYPPFRMHQLEAYAKTEARILNNAQIRILITFNEITKLGHILKSFVPHLKHITTPHALLKDAPTTDIYPVKDNHFALIQYTSGSTNDPKGVLLSHHNLLSNIRAYGKAINITPEDIAVSWLPLYHDMGLIGMWLGSIYHGVPLILMTPFSFLNHPERWLWMMHRHRGTLSGAPNFAYELCTKKIDPEIIDGLDLSAWRMAANGAEKVYAKTLEAFANKFEPYGFKRTALTPVYGLAESTVALSIPSMGQGVVVDYIDQMQFEENQLAIPSTAAHALAFVNCGHPIPEHEVKIVNEANQILPDRHVGSLQFRGPSSMQSYYRNPAATDAIYHDGWLDSGDLAYQVAGDLYITGRKKDLIIKAGRNIYPAEIEEVVATVTDVRSGCVVAFGVSDHTRGTEQLIVIAETKEKDKTKRAAIISQIKQKTSDALTMTPDQVVLVAPQIIPKTSSGKLQRAQCKALYLAERLGKRPAPTWLQIVRLGGLALLKNGADGVSTLYQFIYTVYIALIALLTFPIIYAFVLFAPPKLFSKAMRLWAKFCISAAFWRMKVTHAHYLTQESPVIFASNHASYLDAVVMLALLPPRTRFIAKKELWQSSIFGAFIRKLNGLPIDRMDLSKGIEDTTTIEQALKAGDSVLIFPEGTFGYTSGLRPFKLGAFKMAVETNTAICPIALSGTRDILRDHDKLMKPNKITVTIGKPILPPGKAWQDVIHFRDVVRTEIAKTCGEATLDFIVVNNVRP